MTGPRSTDDPATAERDLSHKVFGLGLARTGTTSLHLAMGELGLRSAPDSIPLLDTIDLDFLERYDAFFDNPIPFRYRELAEVCPGSRYIVTHRAVEPWLRSMAWLFGPGLDRLDPSTRAVGDRVHRAVYGTEVFDPDVLREVHRRHEAEVRAFVENRPHLWLDTDDGLDWRPICELLDLPIPTVPFPRSNAGGRRWWARRRP